MTREYLDKANKIRENLEHCQDVRRQLDRAWAVQFWDEDEHSLHTAERDEIETVDGRFFAELISSAKAYYELKIEQFEREFNEL